MAFYFALFNVTSVNLASFDPTLGDRTRHRLRVVQLGSIRRRPIRIQSWPINYENLRLDEGQTYAGHKRRKYMTGYVTIFTIRWKNQLLSNIFSSFTCRVPKERAQRLDYTQIRTQHRGRKTYKATKPRRHTHDNHDAQMVEENLANERKAAMMHFLHNTSSSVDGSDVRTKRGRSPVHLVGTAAAALSADGEERPNVTHKREKKKSLLLEKVNIYEMILTWWNTRQKARSKDSLTKAIKRNKPTDNGSCRARTAVSLPPSGRSGGAMESDKRRNALLEIRWVIMDECCKVKTEPLNRKFRGNESDDCRRQSCNSRCFRNRAFQMQPI